MAHSRGKKFLEMKLAFLEEQEQQLSSLIHEKINKCKSWLSNSSDGGTRCSLREMNQMIEDTVDFVTNAVTQIEGECHESVPQESSSESSALLTVASCDSSSLAVDKSELTSLEPRTKKMEAAVRAITDNLEILRTRLSNIENGMEDLSIKYSKTEDKWMKQFNQVDGQMVDLRQREDEFVQQHDREIQSLKEELQTTRTSQEELKKDMTGQIQRKETLQSTLDTFQQDVGTVQVDVQKLRDAIQEQGDALQGSKDDATKLKELIDGSLTPKILSLELKCARPAVGFTTTFWAATYNEGDTVTGYTDVKCNTDKSFNAGTGIFTAPVKGMYGVCLNAYQNGVGEVTLRVLQTRKSCISSEQAEPEYLFGAQTDKDSSSDTVLVVTDMNVEDTVHVEVETIRGDVSLDSSQFTCFLIH